jgi:adenylosuccinate lyase
VGDNTDIIQMKESLVIVRDKIIRALDVMKVFAEKYKDMATLG